MGKVHVSNNCKTYSMTLADASVITPDIYDATYINFLINYSYDNHISAIIPLFDIDLPILAKNREKFTEAGIKVIVSDFDVTQICNDKWKSHNFFIQKGFLTPGTFISLQECLNALSQGAVYFPLIIKPRWGMGSISVYSVSDHNELHVLYTKVRNEIEKTYLRFESKYDNDKCVVIQQYLAGEEYGLDILNDLNGDLLACIPKKKISMRAGETDIALTVDCKELSDIGSILSSEVKHIGNMDVDCIKHEGRFYILEMNCRFGGQYPFCHVAGANFPKVIVDLLLNTEPDPRDLHATYGVYCVKDIRPQLFNW